MSTTVVVLISNDYARIMGREPKSVEVELPEGWYRVLSGVVKPGDRYLNGVLAHDGIIRWEDVTLPIPPPREVNGEAHWYGCLIRQGTPVEELCPRCHQKPIAYSNGRKNKYCSICCYDVTMENRQTHGR